MAVTDFRSAVTAFAALALQSTALAAQPAPAARTLVTFTDDSIKEFRVSPNARFVLLGNKTKLRMFDVASRQSWDLAVGNASDMAWSPKGDRVAWTQGTGMTDYNVWVLPVDASTGKARGEPQRLTTGRSAWPEFSVDGRWIAFTSFDAQMQEGLSIAPATGGPVRVVASRYKVGDTFFSADGKSIFVRGEAATPTGFGIVKFAVDGGKRELLLATAKGEVLVGATADRGYLILSRPRLNQSALPGDLATIIDTTGRIVGHVPLPAGQGLGFAGSLGDSALVWIRRETDHSVLEVRPVVGGSAKRLPAVGESNIIPRWSPDGKRIAFLVPSAGPTSLAIADADGSNARSYRELEVKPNEYVVQWSPDSRSVAVIHADKNRLSVLDVADGTIRTVLDDSIGQIRWRSDGKAILFRNRRMPGGGIDEVTLNGQNRRLLDWPMPNKDVNWAFVGDSSIFQFTILDTAAYLRPLGAAPARHLTSVPPGWDVRRPKVSGNGRLVAGLLASHAVKGEVTTEQLALFNLETGARRSIDLPFSWLTGGVGNQLTFLPGDSALLVFGQRAGEARVKLFRVPLSGAAPSVFADVGTPLPDGEVFAASVSPDGRSVVYSVHPESSARSLVLIDLRGTIGGTSRPPR
jgi:Tol biopolymer transport system component